MNSASTPLNPEPADSVPDLDASQSVEEQVEELEANRMPEGTLDDHPDRDPEDETEEDDAPESVQEEAAEEKAPDRDPQVELRDLGPNEGTLHIADEADGAGDALEQMDTPTLKVGFDILANPTLKVGFDILAKVPAHDSIGKMININGLDTDNGDSIEEAAITVTDEIVEYLSSFTKSQTRDGTLVLSFNVLNSECKTSECTRASLTELVESFLVNVCLTFRN